MKIWKKKLKKNEIIISEPQSLHLEQNGIDNAAFIDETRNQSEDASTNRDSSVDSRRSSRSFARSDPSVGEESNFESEEDYSDSSEDEETSNCQTPTPADVEKQKLKRPKKKLNPIVNSCCGFCSLGAGSLLTGLMYICFGIGYLVYRINDFNYHRGKNEEIFTGRDFYKDIWRVLLIIGMAVISISMVGAAGLLIASCVFGQKEHYSKMRNAAIVWCLLTALAVLWNIGEGVFVIIIPAQYDQKVGSTGIVSNRLVYKDIKSQLPTIWSLTGLYTLFYVYLVIVLISYLRLLKYKGAPKVGGADPAEVIKKTSRPGSQIAGSMRSRSRQEIEMIPRTNSTQTLVSRSQQQDETQLTRSTGSRTVSKTSDFSGDFQTESSIYVNWPHLDKDSAIGPSPVNDLKTNVDDEESLADDPLPSREKNQTLSTTNKEEEEPPPLLPKDNINADEGIIYTNVPQPKEPLQVDDLNAQANSILSLSNSLLKEMESQQASSGRAELTYSSPSSKPMRTNGSMQEQSKPELQTKAPQETHFKADDTTEEPKIEPAVVSKFFKRLSDETVTDNPLEEMFRLFGGDLCNQHPENCQRYLKSYKDVRSKSSHLNSIRDPYEFRKLECSPTPANAIAPPIQFALSTEETYSASNSVYAQDSAIPFLQPPSRHFSQTKRTPDPVAGYRPRSRENRNSYDSRTGYDPRAVTGYRDPPVHNLMKSHMLMQTLPQSRRYSDNRSIYSTYSRGYNPYADDDCSTCYGDYGMYGAYSDCYSVYGYYPEQHRQERRHPSQIYSIYDPLPSQPSMQSSMYNPSQVRFNINQGNRTISKQSKSSSSHWVPVNNHSDDDYSAYRSAGNNFRSSRSLSMPNLAESELERPSSVASTDTAFSKPLGPEFTLPSPRETNRLSRSTSWSSLRHQSTRENENFRRSSSKSRTSHVGTSSTLRNYSGYHTGDLRRNTSHTFQREDDRWQERNLAKSRNLSRISNGSRPSIFQQQRWFGEHASNSSRNPSFSYDPTSGRGRTSSKIRTSEPFSHPQPRLSRTSSNMRSDFEVNSGYNSRSSRMNFMIPSSDSHQSPNFRPSQMSMNRWDQQPQLSRTSSSHTQMNSDFTRLNSDHSRMHSDLPRLNSDHSRMHSDLPSLNSGHLRMNSRILTRPSQTRSEFSHSSPLSHSPSYNHDRDRNHRNTSESRDAAFGRGRTASSRAEHSRPAFDIHQNRETLRRSRSVRRDNHKDTRLPSKQVKFGSTPDLRRI